jgi:hypothetical protein
MEYRLICYTRRIQTCHQCFASAERVLTSWYLLSYEKGLHEIFACFAHKPYAFDETLDIPVRCRLLACYGIFSTRWSVKLSLINTNIKLSGLKFINLTDSLWTVYVYTLFNTGWYISGILVVVIYGLACKLQLCTLG